MANLRSWSERLSDRATLMGRMIERIDIDPVAASHAGLGGILGQAARSCMLCREEYKCRAFLDGNPQPGFEKPMRFCPNASVFAAMARRPAA